MIFINETFEKAMKPAFSVSPTFFLARAGPVILELILPAHILKRATR